MTFRRSSLAALLVASLPIVAAAQQPWQLARTTGLTVAMDTSVVAASDSLHATKGLTMAQLRKLIGVRAFDSLVSANIIRVAGLASFNGGAAFAANQRLTWAAHDTVVGLTFLKDTVGGTPIWLSPQTFATGQLVDSATGAVRSATLTTGRTLSISGDLTYTSPSFNGSANVTAAGTLASVATAGTTGSSTAIPVVTINAKGLTTGITTAAVIAPALTLSGATLASGVTGSSLTSFGSGARTDSTTGAARASALVGSPAITVSSCTGCGGGATVQDTVRAVTFDSVKATRMWNALGSATVPSYSFTQARGAGMYAVGNATADTVRFATDSALSLSLSGGATAKLVGGAGNFTLQCGTGNSRTCTFQSTSSTGVPLNTLILNADTTAVFLNLVRTQGGLTVGGSSGSAIVPGTFGIKDAGTSANLTAYGPSGTAHGIIQFIAGGTNGTAVNGTVFYDSTGFYPSITNALQLGASGAAWTRVRADTIGNDAGNLVVQCGTGNSRTCTIQTTTSSGATKNVVVLGADSSTTLLGSLKAADSVTFTKSVAAGVGDDYICRSGAGVLHDGATCAASTRKIKQNIKPITNGLASVLALKPSAFDYQKGFYDGKHDEGFIADEVAKVNPTFAQYSAKRDSLSNGEVIEKGEPNAINYMAIIAELVASTKELAATAQAQQRQVDSLLLVVKTHQKPASDSSSNITTVPRGAIRWDEISSYALLDNAWQPSHANIAVTCNPKLANALTRLISCSSFPPILSDTSNVYTFPSARVVKDSAGVVQVQPISRKPQ